MAKKSDKTNMSGEVKGRGSVKAGDQFSRQAFSDFVEEYVRRGFNRDRATQLAMEATTKERGDAAGRPMDRDIDKLHGTYILPSNPRYTMLGGGNK